MPRYKLTIEYDGAPFAGWQIQADQADRAGRADRGGRGLSRREGRWCTAPGAPMPACMRSARWRMSISRKDWDTDTVRDALNAHLRPHPVGVLAAERVADDFDARISAVKRHYLYRIINRRADLALDRGRAWRVPRPLDAAAMQAAAQRLVGKHDFTTFRSTECQAKSPVKTLDRLDVDARRRGGERARRRRARSCTTRCARWSARWSRWARANGAPTISPPRSPRATAPPAARWRRRTGFIWCGWIIDRSPKYAQSDDDRFADRSSSARAGRRSARARRLMHGLPDQAEFHHRAIVRDEARVGGAAGGGEFRLAAGDFGDRVGHQIGERARLGDEHAGVRRLPLETRT